MPDSKGFDCELDDADAEELQELEDCQLHAVRHGLFLGSMAAEASLGSAPATGVTHVLQVGGGLRPSFPDKFEYKQVVVDDDEREDLVAHFSACFSFIDQALQNEREAGGVLVHCSAGCSRSASVCLGYVMWKEGLCYDEAWRVVHSARPCICPNDGFKKQLREFERIGYDLSKWISWEAVEAQQSRAATETKLVTDSSKFCSLGPI
uniref:Protein-tyrosine-phosphatase n=1 Tax=Tetraselmis chuii TaxID=63592 RepID=A0A7S1X4L4_9CHLO|mmetsp:Transcript_27768/g.49593  ORF Transcript_27768/g.49593 Transcript_27768/m.49593 type:complete len:207 (+) Transcript_27768:104-724(+)